MLEYQSKYVKNTEEIAKLSDFYSGIGDGYDAWLAGRQQAAQKIRALRQENVQLLEDGLFKTLDELYDASPEVIADLEEFSDALMDWQINLDIGVYVTIHDALLRVYRLRRDREAMIRELYKLGMGLFYQNRIVDGIDKDLVRQYHFQNEMVFTEAGSYLKYFASMEKEETKGYIIRSLANIAIASHDLKRKVAASSRVLQIVQDDYYRNLAPGLPWDAFLRKTNQQMSANRAILSKGGLTSDDLAAVLESCHEVFTPEVTKSDPNIRWLWPYYEMEYTCGFVDLETTMERLEKLIDLYPYDQLDYSGLYANVQLPIYYGTLMRDNPSTNNDTGYIRFLDHAYRKMMQALKAVPVGEMDDFYYYLVRLVISDFFELPGTDVITYREVIAPLMKRLAGNLYIRSRKTGKIMKTLTAAALEESIGFFDDIPWAAEITDPKEKKEALLSYAEDAGLYHDFGLIKMNLTRISQTRNLFDEEYQRMTLHTVSGYEDLNKRASTEKWADIALGHQKWYDGTDGYPDIYKRLGSPYRQMTDIAAVAAWLTDEWEDREELHDLNMPDTKSTAGSRTEDMIKEACDSEHTRFSPLITQFLADQKVTDLVAEILQGDTECYYKELFEGVQG